ncbi:MAG: hypothetical protein UX35_C0001G0141 [Microgenomates group bacterium GW2011_GWA1_46_15]|nr:MAG: hypothetical protein UX00_C0001G0051 [Microgenomates group bacterium GW2011_GWB1_45_17]KKU24243.1 MAG: hypothetical protein UX36_C0002G0226 [Microgenomates group bacterium GW2011_GWC1_46_15]KKU24959.1 MAG: hypothetical protein UX35_C0001G0141 [Microgenomates group bacterium GW2011_GWA1_46_15]
MLYKFLQLCTTSDYSKKTTVVNTYFSGNRRLCGKKEKYIKRKNFPRFGEKAGHCKKLQRVVKTVSTGFICMISRLKREHQRV